VVAVLIGRHPPPPRSSAPSGGGEQKLSCAGRQSGDREERRG